MTDNEIIKALECCVVNENCKGCPLINKPHCLETAVSKSIDLINRQKAEIERLEKDSKRLKKVQMQLDDAMKMYTTAKVEAVREFADKLKEQFDHLMFVTGDEVKNRVDKLVKEMVGESANG